MTDDALVASDVTFTYPGETEPVLVGASCSIAPGSRWVLLGGNGSGKSTLLRCLSGAVQPDGGTVRRYGELVRYDRAGLIAHRRQVQLVLQDPDDQLFAATVAQDVSYGPVHMGCTQEQVRERVAESLAALAISHLHDRPIHHLSYGQRKRVAVAGALAMRPDVLLLDEPTAGLDPAAVTDLLNALSNIAANAAVVMATHDVDLALEWAEHAIVIGEGRLTHGAVQTVLAHDQSLRRSRLARPTLLQVVSLLIDRGLLDSECSVRSVADLEMALAATQGGVPLD